jgi:dipeptidyl aminopeptidase/acylaminoacyl peptidase
VQRNKDQAARANPITYITPDDPPFLILHGDRDPVVPYNQSELLLDALKQAGLDATLIKVQGAGHGGPLFQSDENARRIVEFFEKHLSVKNASSGSR